MGFVFIWDVSYTIVYHCQIKIADFVRSPYTIGLVRSKPIPVRLDDETIGLLDAAASNTGLNRAALIRLCVAAFLDDYSRGGEVSLPLDWRTILEAHDGRKHKGGKSQSR